MIKSILTAIVIASATFGFSGQISWVSYLGPSLMSNISVGDAAVLYFSSSSIDQTSISNTIKANGLSTALSDYSLSSGNIAYPAQVVTDSGEYYIGQASLDYAATLLDAGDYYGIVMITSSDGNSFALSEVQQFNVAVATPGIFDNFGANTEDLVVGSWQTGSIGGGGAAPEPTVLALIALGVAGLALKRRV